MIYFCSGGTFTAMMHARVADALARMHPHFAADADQREQMRERRRVEHAQRPVERLAHGAEDRAAQRQRALPPPQLRHGAAAAITPPDDLLRELHRHARAHHHRQRANERALDRREIVERPLRRVFAGPRRDERVRLPFLPEKTQHRRKRREPDLAVAHAGRVQPVLVELEARRHEVRDPLMEARDQHAPDSRSIHSSDILPPATEIRCGREPSSQAAMRGALGG